MPLLVLSTYAAPVTARKRSAWLLGCAFLGALLGVAAVVLFNSVCEQPLVCNINPDPNGPYCLPPEECSTYGRDNALIVLAGMLLGLVACAATMRLRRDRVRE